MAIQVTCLSCGSHFVVHSANISIIPLELDWQRLEVQCPYCLEINKETLQPIKPQFDKPKTPQEARDERFNFAIGAVVSNVVTYSPKTEGVEG